MIFMAKHPQIGLIKDGKCRKTGTHIQVDFGLNEGGHYQASCYGKEGEYHGFYVNADTRKAILELSAHPDEWCPKCYEVIHGE